MAQQDYKYYAFISYSSRDTEWGKRLQRKLEHYKMPATLCSERGWKRTPIKPVFFAPTDIQPGGLTEELQERLRTSRNLIVVCSPHSAQSKWVGMEIAFFHQLGRTDRIHFFIVDGKPHSGDSDTECFNPIVDTLGLPEILGANIHEKVYPWPWMNRERAYVQLVSKLLGVEFDAIWQRHKRRLRRQAAIWTVGTLAVVATVVGVWMMNQPVDIEVRLSPSVITPPSAPQKGGRSCTQPPLPQLGEAGRGLLPPLRDAVVTIALDNETKTDTIHSIDDAAVLTNIPHRYMGREVHVSVTCRDYLPLDTTVVLSRSLTLPVRRDPAVYGTIQFTLWNADTETALSHVPVTVGGIATMSDDEGRVRLTIPLEDQRLQYAVTADVPLRDTVIIVPHTEDAIITVE